MTSDPIPVACSLSGRDARSQAAEWVDLQRCLSRSRALPRGAEMVFPAGLHSRITELAEREAACCAFLDITTALEADEVVVTITSDNPDALDVIALLSGVVAP